jgi:hypothetical protein
MDDSTGESNERLLRLELNLVELRRSNRRLRLVLAALALTGGALVTMAQAPSGVSESTEAHQFVLRDSSGRVRAALGTTPDGAVGLSLDDANGRTRITLDVEGNGSPGLDLYDQDGKRRAIIALGEQGTPGVGLYDAGGKLRASLDVPAANNPGLTFYKESGKPAWGVP